MFHPFKHVGSGLAVVWPCLFALAILPGCQSPQGAAEAKNRAERGKLAEAGFLKWRTNYLHASDRLANAPAWAPTANQPEPRLAERKSAYSQIRVTGKVVAMTFDDGPHPSNTPRLLDILKQRHLKATFFIVGQSAKEYPDILRRISAEGHEIGNHTWSHAYLTKLSMGGVRKEITDTQAAITAATGTAPTLFRPPYGAVNSAVKSLLFNEFNCTTILWSVDPEDWKRPGISVVTSRLVNGAHSGAILLAHDIHGPTIEAMPATFDRLLSLGYKFVTVSQLIQMEEPPSAAQGPESGNSANAEALFAASDAGGASVLR